ncbi:hypothetical protein [Salininema proteolyticum]|uniref:AbiTii domain-containing protein n=1 Tax=Salininema proteolyticum TaxID=1607685 RepID=A0ABV8TTR9_9ACTN
MLNISTNDVVVESNRVACNWVQSNRIETIESAMRHYERVESLNEIHGFLMCDCPRLNCSQKSEFLSALQFLEGQHIEFDQIWMQWIEDSRIRVDDVLEVVSLNLRTMVPEIVNAEPPEAKRDTSIELHRLAISSVCRGLIRLAEAYYNWEPSKPLVSIPWAVNMPRYPELKDHVTPGLIIRDLETQIGAALNISQILYEENGRKYSEDDGDPPYVEALHWRSSTRETLLQFKTIDVVGEFDRITRSMPWVSSPFIEKSHELALRFLKPAHEYLQGLRNRMVEFNETTGTQETYPVVMHIRDNKFYGSQIAAQLTTLNSTIKGVEHAGNQAIADALTSLQKAIAEDRTLSDENRAELVDNVSLLAESAQLAPEKRRQGLLRASVSALSHAAKGAESLRVVWDKVGDPIYKFFF